MIRFIKLILIQIGLIKIKEVIFSEITFKKAQGRLIKLGAMPNTLVFISSSLLASDI